jgi:hypothetical protein
VNTGQSSQEAIYYRLFVLSSNPENLYPQVFLGSRIRAIRNQWSIAMDVLGSTVLSILIFVLLVLVLGSFFTVKTAQVAVITRFGKFLRAAEPGLNWKWPLIDTVAGRVSLRVNQISLTMETKTKDNVFVTIPISVQNRVRPE